MKSIILATIVGLSMAYAQPSNLGATQSSEHSSAVKGSQEAMRIVTTGCMDRRGPAEKRCENHKIYTK